MSEGDKSPQSRKSTGRHEHGHRHKEKESPSGHHGGLRKEKQGEKARDNKDQENHAETEGRLEKIPWVGENPPHIIDKQDPPLPKFYPYQFEVELVDVDETSRFILRIAGEVGKKSAASLHEKLNKIFKKKQGKPISYPDIKENQRMLALLDSSDLRRVKIIKKAKSDLIHCFDLDRYEGIDVAASNLFELNKEALKIPCQTFRVELYKLESFAGTDIVYRAMRKITPEKLYMCEVMVNKEIPVVSLKSCTSKTTLTVVLRPLVKNLSKNVTPTSETSTGDKMKIATDLNDLILDIKKSFTHLEKSWSNTISRLDAIEPSQLESEVSNQQELIKRTQVVEQDVSTLDTWIEKAGMDTKSFSEQEHWSEQAELESQDVSKEVAWTEHTEGDTQNFSNEEAWSEHNEMDAQGLSVENPWIVHTEEGSQNVSIQEALSEHDAMDAQGISVDNPWIEHTKECSPNVSIQEALAGHDEIDTQGVSVDNPWIVHTEEGSQNVSIQEALSEHDAMDAQGISVDNPWIEHTKECSPNVSIQEALTGHDEIDTQGVSVDNPWIEHTEENQQNVSNQEGLCEYAEVDRHEFLDQEAWNENAEVGAQDVSNQRLYREHTEMVEQNILNQEILIEQPVHKGQNVLAPSPQDAGTLAVAINDQVNQYEDDTYIEVLEVPKSGMVVTLWITDSFSADDFSVQIYDVNEPVVSLEHEMGAYYDSVRASHTAIPVCDFVKDRVYAFYSDFGRWVRCKLLNVTNGVHPHLLMITLRFLDYGFWLRVTLVNEDDFRRLYPLDSRFCKLPQQGFTAGRYIEPCLPDVMKLVTNFRPLPGSYAQFYVSKRVEPSQSRDVPHLETVFLNYSPVQVRSQNSSNCAIVKRMPQTHIDEHDNGPIGCGGSSCSLE